MVASCERGRARANLSRRYRFINNHAFHGEADMVDARIERLLDDNRAAVAELVAAARAIDEREWHRPIAEEKWSASQQVDHVARAYGAAVLDLREGKPMRMIGTARQRRWWRLAGLSMVRLLGRLPRGAPAPREIRPEVIGDRTTIEQLTELDERVREFEQAIRDCESTKERGGFTHPYFGVLSLRDGVRLLAVHTKHHARALRSAATISAG